MRAYQTALMTILAVVIVLSTALPLAAGPNDPITGEDFDRLVARQDVPLQNRLREILPESQGYFVTGPLPEINTDDRDITKLYRAVRILCPDLNLLREAIDILQKDTTLEINKVETWLDKPCKKNLSGFRGAFLTIEWEGTEHTVRLVTPQQVRFTIWAARQQFPMTKAVRSYALAVSDYLKAIDNGNLDAAEPRATAFGLPDSVDFYAEPPDYVIEGYDNYMAFLYSHRPIYTDFSQGIEAFIPSDSLLEAIKAKAPAIAYPNKEWPMLQREYRKFFARGGDIRIMNTLTAAGFDTLGPGEHFYVVGVDGKIRFGRELPRAEVDRIEQETGRKLARANHAFLLPGEPVLTSGAFFIEIKDGHPRLTAVNAQSGHYFYSNVSSTIREDIVQRSDKYLMTLGHFFLNLDRLGISYDRVLISKF